MLCALVRVVGIGAYCHCGLVGFGTPSGGIDFVRSPRRPLLRSVGARASGFQASVAPPDPVADRSSSISLLRRGCPMQGARVAIWESTWDEFADKVKQEFGTLRGDAEGQSESANTAAATHAAHKVRAASTEAIGAVEE
jgi:hypothetical protein